MQKQLALNPDRSLPDALADSFDAMLAEAHARADSALTDPQGAVHNFRRALRRAEALLDLAAPFLRKHPLAWLDTALRRARRKTRLLRDLDALAERLNELRPEVDALADEAPDETAGPDEAAEPRTPTDAILGLIEAVRGELASPELVAWRLRANLRELAGLGAIFRAGLVRFEADALLASARETYRSARAARRKAAREGTAESLHDLRKAARVLRYQLELLASGDLVASAEDHAAEVRQLVSKLGALTDLFALHGLVRASDRETLGLAPRRLARGLEVLMATRTGAIFDAADAVFALRPRDFLAAMASGTELEEDVACDVPRDEPSAEDAPASEDAEG
jgi:CHAD domain-containing protein